MTNPADKLRAHDCRAADVRRIVEQIAEGLK